MDTPLVIRPRLWLLFGAVAAIVLVPAALSFVPNPLEGLGPEERPSRFFATLWLLLPILMLLSVWRVLAWTSYRATREWIEARSMLGVKRSTWSELSSFELDTPVGMPPAYELRFGKRKVRFIAAHHDRTKIQALKALIAR
ncbi:MAG: hypothetical protein NT015_02345 [Alphaproteobacteria bacterium]|nr:hypothetical protein [Alphaproteobacteria bacterium]